MTMSPRRSSRARSSQNPPAAPPHTSSSSSTATMAKDNRNTRLSTTNTRTASPTRRTSTVRSESIEGAESTSRTTDGVSAPRRSRRVETDIFEKKDKQVPDDDDEEVEDAQEEEVTRCICGRPEYPGPGASVKEQMPSNESISDDIGNFFVQCDKCHVWQHGGCMGLTDDTNLPEEYYCEICRPESHRIIKNANGTKSSRYLPVLEGAISDGSSPLSSAGGTSRKSSTKNRSLETTKRRATMNSRGAYDEDEMLRRAIEESREMGTLKRSRDDTDEIKQATKRQRTSSSPSSVASRHSRSPMPTTEDPGDRPTTNGLKNGSKFRGTVVKNNKEKEIRDKQKEALASQRAEAASKRNARSERRRAEDSPPPTPTLSPSKPPASLAKQIRATKDSTPPTKSATSRKGGRPPARRGRLGRNQYTRDLPTNGDTSDSPLRDTSRDPNHVDSPRLNMNGNIYKDNINGESGRSSKAKTHSARTSMNEMKRRVAAILEFVGRMQNERGSNARKSRSDPVGGSRSSGSDSSSLKGTSTPNGSGLSAGLTAADLAKAVARGLEDDQDSVKRSEDDQNEEAIMKVEVNSGKPFEDMNSGQMMESLTSELVKWQNAYGIYAR